jgi:signal transduction histidine kinase
MRVSVAAGAGEGQANAITASGGAVPIPGGNPHGTRILAELVLLALSTPALMAALELAEVDHEVILLAVGLWSIVQMTLLIAVARGHAFAGASSRFPDGSETELGQRAELAEAAVRREEERLHEVRATVSSIGMTHRLLLERSAELPLPTRTRLEGLYESELSRLLRLVDEGGPVHSEVQTLDLAPLIAPLIESLCLRGVSVRWGGGSARATGRPDEVVQIVQGLLENAVRHAKGADVSVSISTVGDEVWVDVSDDGLGISTRLRSRLFERGARRDGSPGHGLGLHIARRLAREMGGDLRLHPDSGPRGAGFTLMLPASVEGAACLARTE